MLGEANLITAAVAKVTPRIEALGDRERAVFNSNLSIDFEEHFQYQEMQARAHLEGRLTTDEAQLVYRALGEVGDPNNGGWAEGTTEGMKVVVTMLMGKLISARISAARS